MVDRRTLFVQNIHPEATRDAIWNAFLIFGEINDVRIDKPKSTCLVEFEEEGDAAAAVDNMHLSELYGQTIQVTYATKGNLVDRRKAIWEFEAQAGEVKSGNYQYLEPKP
ncbi:putative peptidyl-prolyl cis-trans isomerase E [Histomonas meleagridis]|uniref:putative peptidyl-prolyl cis-trans isomerase E n=1 Tax=Histomonas meleagridis TaxID=135588 RepID=UPI00355ACB57|nr:putative peptidyl-prolyl cis-trans isomerase E [Histomonas meleagridis]KAH0802009.1 putative peptidyl-prolyl cis-trans isomerase E [Histomonas meleagridis]